MSEATPTEPATTDAPSVPAIYGAICELMNHVESIKKSRTSDHGKFEFRGIDDVLNSVGPAMRELCIFATPRVLNYTRTLGTSKTGGGLMNTVVEVEFDFIAGADGSMHTVGPVIGEGMDSGDKSAAKAMSVAYRIALIQLLAIPTGDRDPDHDVYERAAGATPANGETRPRRAPSEDVDPWANSNPDLVKFYTDAINATKTDDALKVIWAEIVADVKSGKLAEVDGNTLKLTTQHRIAAIQRADAQDADAERPQDR